MKIRINWVIVIFSGLLLAGCGMFWRMPGFDPGNGPSVEGPPNAANGERIYFTAASGRGGRISYSGGPNFGGMMMGAYLTCAACHGPGARGGEHAMHMQVMDAPDITYTALSGEAEEHGGGEGHEDEHSGEYSLEDFRRAVIDGEHPDGEPLGREMPRWRMSDEDLADLFAYLKTLSE